jgi:hypothetical protein
MKPRPIRPIDVRALIVETNDLAHAPQWLKDLARLVGEDWLRRYDQKRAILEVWMKCKGGIPHDYACERPLAG